MPTRPTRPPKIILNVHTGEQLEMDADLYDRIYPPVQNDASVFATLLGYLERAKDWIASISFDITVETDSGIHTCPFYATVLLSIVLSVQLFRLYCWMRFVRFVRICKAVHKACPDPQPVEGPVVPSRYRKIMIALATPNGGRLSNLIFVVGLCIAYLVCRFRSHPVEPKDVSNLRWLSGLAETIKHRGQDILNWETVRSWISTLGVPFILGCGYRLAVILEHMIGLDCKCCCVRGQASEDNTAPTSTDAECAVPSELAPSPPAPQPSAPTTMHNDAKESDDEEEKFDDALPPGGGPAAAPLPMPTIKRLATVSSFNFAGAVPPEPVADTATPFARAIRAKSQDLFMNRGSQLKLAAVDADAMHRANSAFALGKSASDA